MRVYGVIQTRFWTHPEIQLISDQAKLLAIYLLSSSHTNMLGCFRIPVGYVAEDLKWTPEKVIQGFGELTGMRYLMRDDISEWVLICNFLKYHPIENPNQAKSIEAIFTKIPCKLFFIPELVSSLLTQDKHFRDAFRNRLETHREPLSNQDQKQEQNQDQDQDIKDMSGKPDASFLFTTIKSQQALLRSQALEVLTFLNEKTGRAYRLVDSNINMIVNVLKSDVTVMDCRKVIAKKYRDWIGDEKMQSCIRPKTLFKKDNFEQYLGEVLSPKVEEDENESS